MTQERSQVHLSRRERQIMEIVYRHGRGTVGDVLAALPDPPSYSAVRALLNVLEEKGHLRHENDGNRYVYLPTLSREKAQRTALKGVVRTFFDGSVEKAMVALIDLERSKLSPTELGRIERSIERARKEGR